MIILGLTGCIGMGKSTTAVFFKNAGIPVYSADTVVHELYREPKIIDMLKQVFPDAVTEDKVDRDKLSKYIIGNPQNLQNLEELIHPLVRKKEKEFIDSAKMRGEKIILLDIPLLFETGKDKYIDRVIVVTAPFAVQKQRVLSRTDMTEEKFNMILLKQMSDEQKRAKADYIIDTNKGFLSVEQEVNNLLSEINGNSYYQ